MYNISHYRDRYSILYIHIYTYLIDGANLLIKKTKHQENSITLVLNFPQH